MSILNDPSVNEHARERCVCLRMHSCVPALTFRGGLGVLGGHFHLNGTGSCVISFSGASGHS